MTAHVYILRCADGSYYVGTAQQGLEPEFNSTPGQ
jgi:predicted GIY-YIG superfamily endonuclease